MSRFSGEPRVKVSSVTIIGRSGELAEYELKYDKDIDKIMTKFFNDSSVLIKLSERLVKLLRG